jgi:transcriptional regulator with XRE-family HTH domain
MTLGERIRSAREAKGWKIRHLAGALDTTESYISDVELDKVQPSGKRVLAIATALDLTPNDLLKNEIAEVAS